MNTSRPVPASLRDLFFTFTAIGLQGFGGVVPIIQREIVEKKSWMTREEFLEEWAVAQVLPGPNVVNFSLMIGARHFGWRGSLAAAGGLLTLPLVIVLILGMLYATFSNHPGVAGAARGMSAVAAGLIIATGFKLSAGLKTNPLGKIGCVLFGIACFICIAWLRWPLWAVLPTLGPLACFFAYRAMKG